MKCCADCLGDDYLASIFANRFSTFLDDCGYCGKENRVTIEVTSLLDQFLLLSELYVNNSTDGRPLHMWLREDFGLFKKMSPDQSAYLIKDIFESEAKAFDLVVPRSTEEAELLVEWGEFEKELRSVNRFFVKKNVSLENIERLLRFLACELSSVSDVWFRARINANDRTYTCCQMRAPPPKKTPNGRANPVGIPYLYLSSCIATAAAEVRPQTGQQTSVAQFEFDRVVRVIDLRNPRVDVSPFQLIDDEIPIVRGDLDFLDHFAQEMTKPVVTSAGALEYLPTQYICEYIKKCGFDGVVYGSSLGSGSNAALFDTTHGSIRSITSKRITSVNVQWEDL